MTDPVLVLREALDKATEGPWESAYAPRDDDPRKKATFHADLLTNDVEQPLWIVWTRDGSTDVDYVVPAVTGDGPTSRANAEFVAAARNLLPVLLDEVEALRKVVEQVRFLHEDSLDFPGNCVEDGFSWPCHTARLLAVLDKEEK